MSTELVVAIGGWVFSVFTAAIAYKASTRVHRETTRDSDKDIFVASVTHERAKWREDLRQNVAEYLKQCVSTTPDIPELIRLKTDIILRLNPRARDSGMEEKHKFDLEIMQAVNALFNQVAQASIPLTNPTLAVLEKATQELLKQEWQKSKDEAAMGRERSRTRASTSA
ncbi:MAG: hypothetical protein ACO1PM_18330 [Acidovorax sp.]